MATKSKVIAKPNPMRDAWVQTRDGLRNLVSGLGTRADKSYSTAYFLVSMTDEQLITAYRSDWIVRKAVDIPALDAVREWRTWQASDTQIQDIADVETRLGLRQKVRDCLIRARLLGGAVLVMGIGSESPEKEMVPENVKKDDLKFVHVMARNEITTGPLNLDPLDEFYGEPEYYEIRTDKKGIVKIHPSRVVRLIGNPTPLLSIGQAWGDSILLSIDDAVKQAGTAAQSLVALIQEAKTDIVKIPDLMNNLSTAEYEQKLLERFSLAGTTRSVVNTYILDSEEEWQRSQTNFSSLPDAVRLYLQIVSGAADIPATRMLGQSPGGIVASGDTDTRNYYDRVSSEQENTLRPALRRLDEALIRSALGSRPDEIYYDWAPLWQMDEAQKANMVLAKAQALQIHHDTGLLDPVALSEGFINQLIADNVYPGLSINIEDNAKNAPALNEDPAQIAALAAMKGAGGAPGGPAGKAGKGGTIPPNNPPSQNPGMVAKQKAVAKDYNECHNPEGPGGGQFCSEGGGSGPGGPGAQSLYEKNLEKYKNMTEDEFLKTLTQEQRDAIDEAERLLSEGVPMNAPVEDGGFMRQDGTYTPEIQEWQAKQLADIFNDDAVSRATPEEGEEPTAILLGGRSGSGKSTALKEGGVPYDSTKFINLNADDIQENIPGYNAKLAGFYNGLAQDTVAMAEKYARTNGLNYVYDATLKSTAPALTRMQELKNAGYRVEGYFVHTMPSISTGRVVERFIRNGRYVPIHVPLNSFTNETSFDTIKPGLAKYRIYDNNGSKPVIVESGGTEFTGSILPGPGGEFTL